MDLLYVEVLKPPEFHYARSGLEVCTFWACDPGQLENIRCVLFGTKAVGFASDVVEGDLIYLAGEFKDRSWTGRDGTRHETTEFTVRRWSREEFE